VFDFYKQCLILTNKMEQKRQKIKLVDNKTVDMVKSIKAELSHIKGIEREEIYRFLDSVYKYELVVNNEAEWSMRRKLCYIYSDKLTIYTRHVYEVLGYQGGITKFEVVYKKKGTFSHRSLYPAVHKDSSRATFGFCEYVEQNKENVDRIKEILDMTNVSNLLFMYMISLLGKSDMSLH
jgi:hypothetical protein